MATSTKTSHTALGAVWLTIFLDLVGFSIIFPLFPAILEWYLPREGSDSFLASLIRLFEAWSPAETTTFTVAVLFGGFLGSLYSLLQFFFSPFWGRLSDRYGRRQILLITSAGTAFSYLLWALSGNFLLFILARIFGGCMAGNLSVATAAIADITSTTNRSKGMALVGVAFGLGFILGPGIGGTASLVSLPYDPNASAVLAFTPFSFPALLAFGLAILNWIWIYRKFPQTAVSSSSTPERTSLFRLGSANPEIRKTLFTYFAFLCAFAGMEFTLTFLAVERLAYQPHQMAWIFVFVGLVLTLTQGWFVRKYARRIGEKNLVLAGILFCSAGLAALAFAPQSSVFFAALAAMSVGVGCISPSLTALVSLHADPQQQGAELGAFRSTGALARAVGPVCAALLFGAYGSTTAYLAGSFVVLMTLLLAFRIKAPPLLAS